MDRHDIDRLSIDERRELIRRLERSIDAEKAENWSKPTGSGCMIRLLYAALISSVVLALTQPALPHLTLIGAPIVLLGVPLVGCVWICGALARAFGRFEENPEPEPALPNRYMWIAPAILAGTSFLYWFTYFDSAMAWRLRFSEQAIAEFAASVPTKDSEYSPRWIGWVHVGGWHIGDGMVALHTSNGLFCPLGVVQLPEKYIGYARAAGDRVCHPLGGRWFGMQFRSVDDLKKYNLKIGQSPS